MIRDPLRLKMPQLIGMRIIPKRADRRRQSDVSGKGWTITLISYRLLIVMSALALFLSVVRVGATPSLATTRSPHGRLKVPCDSCHTEVDWKVIPERIKFNHAQTKFALRGQHAFVACRDCHATLNFANVPGKCQDCHADLHRRKNGAECELCHNTNGWQVSMQNINAHQDRFPLIGAHAVVDCYSCHKVGTVGKFNRFGLSTECFSCHSKDFELASAPNHRAMRYSTECRECHLSMDSWSGAVFTTPGVISK
jgi:Zn finger protein HypA/HybF involved in hydrogenase expression